MTGARTWRVQCAAVAAAAFAAGTKTSVCISSFAPGMFPRTHALAERLPGGLLRLVLPGRQGQSGDSLHAALLLTGVSSFSNPSVFSRFLF